jgi:hypothetical protein
MAGTLGVTSNTYNEQSQLVAQDGAIMKPATMHGSDMVRGQVMERSGNKYVVLNAAANAAGILVEDAAALGADVEGNVFKAGKFRYEDMVWPTMSAADKKTALEAMEDRGIFVDVDITTVQATA